MSPAANALLGTLRNWYAKPALVMLHPLGMPVLAPEAVAVYELVTAGLVVISSDTAGAIYLQPYPQLEQAEHAA